MPQAARNSTKPANAAVEDAAQAAAGVADEVQGAAGDIKSAAKEHGRHLFETAKSEATGFADRRKDDAAKSVSDIAASLRGTGQSLEERPNIRAFVEGAADGLESLADGLRDRSFADIYGDVEAYARRSPLAVGAVAVAAGFLLARFIKSSSDDLSDKARDSRNARTPSSSGRTRGRAAAVDA